MALFESFPIFNGRAVFLQAHLRRLNTSCEQCGFHLDHNAFDHLPGLFSQIPFNAFARIYVTAGDGSPVSAATQCRIFVLCEPREHLNETAALDGYRLAVHPVPHLPVFSGLKSANYWANIHARQLAIERQKNEALLFNNKGQLISACMANVFVVQNGKVKTPSLECGAREGILRSWVMERCEVAQAILFIDDLKNAEEIFLTSSGIGIMPAASIEGRPLPSRQVATPLRAEYEAFLSRSMRDETP